MSQRKPKLFLDMGNPAGLRHESVDRLHALLDVLVGGIRGGVSGGSLLRHQRILKRRRGGMDGARAS
jgi:hypothetical protein